MRAIKFLCFVFFMSLATACFTTTPLVDPMTAPLNNQAELPAIKKAIVDVATDRGWKLTEKGPGEFLGELRVREHVINTKITYSKSEVKMNYVKSENMNYDGKEIHKKYHMWVQFFLSDVKKKLGIGS